MKKIRFISIFVVLTLLLGSFYVPVYADVPNYKELYLDFAADADKKSENSPNNAVSGMILLDLNRDRIPELLMYATNVSKYDENGNILTSMDEGYDNATYIDYSHTIDSAYSVVDGKVTEDSPWKGESNSIVLSMPCLPGMDAGSNDFCATVMYRGREEYLAMMDGEYGFSILWYAEDGFGFSHDGYDEEFFNLFSPVDLPVSSVAFYDSEKQQKHTYSEAMKILLSDYDNAVSKSSFGVNKVSDWAVAEVNEAWEMNLVPPEMFSDDLTVNVTRAEFAAIAMQLMQAIAGEELNWHGGYIVDIEDNIYEMYIRGAYQLGITKGCGMRDGGIVFEPDLNITREDLVTMLFRIIKMYEIDKMITGESFGYYHKPGDASMLHDLDTVSDYAIEGVYFLSDYGVVNGVTATTFAPFDYATKEQSILLALRIYKFFLSASEELSKINY